MKLWCWDDYENSLQKIGINLIWDGNVACVFQYVNHKTKSSFLYLWDTCSPHFMNKNYWITINRGFFELTVVCPSVYLSVWSLLTILLFWHYYFLNLVLNEVHIVILTLTWTLHLGRFCSLSYDQKCSKSIRAKEFLISEISRKE